MIKIKIPMNKKFENNAPKTLSRNPVGRKLKITPKHVPIIFNKIACITLKRKYFDIGKVPREQPINNQIINIKISKLLSI